jgi:hypothetical protein
MEILGHLRQRRTVRKFKSDPIPQPTLDAMLEAARELLAEARALRRTLTTGGP